MEDPHVCPPKHVHTFDNFLRPLIHRPKKVFGPYIKPGMRVMDIGCGAGFASIGMARLLGNDGEVVAVDLQQEMLDIVKRRVIKAKLTHMIRLQKCEADSLNVDGDFDFVNAFWMVHETPDTRKFLEQVFGILKPGGKLLIAEPRMYVSKKGFEKMIEVAKDIGFDVYKRPRVILSLAVALYIPGTVDENQHGHTRMK